MEQEKVKLIQDEYSIEIPVLQQVVQKYQQREKGTEDVDLLVEQGGDRWLESGLNTDFK